ncbi:MAG: cytochrome c3 family protein, partial [Vicinamibacteria bacterium]|nr:cytochrome c3 family protein [Vicinamibacteria bacterium]
MFKWSALLAVCMWASMSAAADDDCLACHGDKGATDDKGRSLYVDAQARQESVHAGLGCADCHGTVKDFPHPTPMPKPDCAACHEDVIKDYQSSVHASMAKGSGGAVCASCHGSAHAILSKTDPRSNVSKNRLPETCGACHANPDFVARHKISLARPIESYRLSVHGRAVAKGNAQAASCSDCHGSHLILPSRDARAKINHWAVARTCGECHPDIRKTYAGSIHGQATEKGVRESPTCTDCHGEHAILAPTEADSLVNPARVSRVTCGRCHADERLAVKVNLPRDRVPSFEDSFHGLALRAGRQTVANCASCHGVHNILPSSDPRSTVHTANLGRTCGACHPGAGARFAIGQVHISADSQGEHPIVKWIRVSYLFFIIPGTLGLMLLHHAIDFFAKLRRGARRIDNGEEIERMNLQFRIAHLLVILSFPTLVVTGFALTYPDAWWAVPLAPMRGVVHRIAAVLLIVSMLYHAIHLIRVRRDRVILKQLLPAPKDARDAWDTIRHNLGFNVRRPTFGKFNYAEK